MVEHLLCVQLCFSFPFSFQFFTRLGSVFAEEVGRFTFGIIQLCVAILGLRTIGVSISYFKFVLYLPLPNDQR